ncbi:MAG TPA: AgmX/PglI C-terminal domain-containing protein [Polyangiaceae bacterium]|nr:AgmX/PglI C-terminal domain-containing protein [Polyangiaceae bacterium]
MAESTAPPPPKTGSGGFIAAIVVMLLLGGGLIFWKMSGKEKQVAEAPPPPPPKTAEPVLEAPPPPPPPVEEDAGDKKAATDPKRVVGGGGGGCGGDCKGTATPQLQSALRGRAGQSRGCYERGLRQNSLLQGKITIAVRIGPAGQVCSANIASNSVGDPGVASCVLGMFRSGTFPAPKGGCVDAAVPMNFVPKS